jgi:hypothetical protein
VESAGRDVVAVESAGRDVVALMHVFTSSRYEPRNLLAVRIGGAAEEVAWMPTPRRTSLVAVVWDS